MCEARSGGRRRSRVRPRPATKHAGQQMGPATRKREAKAPAGQKRSTRPAPQVASPLEPGPTCCQEQSLDRRIAVWSSRRASWQQGTCCIVQAPTREPLHRARSALSTEASGLGLRRTSKPVMRATPPNVYKLSCGARLAKRAVRAAHLFSSESKMCAARIVDGRSPSTTSVSFNGLFGRGHL